MTNSANVKARSLALLHGTHGGILVLGLTLLLMRLLGLLLCLLQ